jgi:CBS domain-containing membrane protein
MVTPTARRSLQVRELMTAKVVAVRPGHDVATLRDLMLEHGVRHMPVVDAEGDLVGLVSHRDLLRQSLIEQSDTPTFIERAVLAKLQVREIMNTDLETVAPDADIRVAAQTLYENKYGCLPVVDGQRLVGILTESDFVRFLAGGD